MCLPLPAPLVRVSAPGSGQELLPRRKPGRRPGDLQAVSRRPPARVPELHPRAQASLGDGDGLTPPTSSISGFPPESRHIVLGELSRSAVSFSFSPLPPSLPSFQLGTMTPSWNSDGRWVPAPPLSLARPHGVGSLGSHTDCVSSSDHWVGHVHALLQEPSWEPAAALCSSGLSVAEHLDSRPGLWHGAPLAPSRSQSALRLGPAAGGRASGGGNLCPGPREGTSPGRPVTPLLHRRAGPGPSSVLTHRDSVPVVPGLCVATSPQAHWTRGLISRCSTPSAHGPDRLADHLPSCSPSFSDPEVPPKTRGPILMKPPPPHTPQVALKGTDQLDMSGSGRDSLTGTFCPKAQAGPSGRCRKDTDPGTLANPAPTTGTATSHGEGAFVHLFLVRAHPTLHVLA